MIEGGYILQPRCFDNSEAAHFPPCTREVWFFLLRNVNHKDNGKFKRGSGLFHLEDIQDALSWDVGFRKMTYSKPQISKALQRLAGNSSSSTAKESRRDHEGSMIETTKATRGVFVTIRNYDKYQNPKNYEGNDEGNAKETRRKREGAQEKQEWKNERMKEVFKDSFQESSVGQSCPTTPSAIQNLDSEKQESPPQEAPKPDPVPYARIIEHLNQKCGCQYKASSQTTRSHIKARWNEGFRFDDFTAVIDFKFAEWASDEKMCRFIRPQTLFGTKFESYLIAAKKTEVNGREIVKKEDKKLEIYSKKLDELLKGESPFVYANREGIDALRKLQGIAQKAAACA